MTKHVLRLLGLAAALTLVGCGKGAGDPDVSATVTGKVLLPDGKPLPGGTITFQSAAASNKLGTGEIKADGTYEATGVPQGECKVYVVNMQLQPNPNPTSADEKPDPSLQYVPIDAKYSNAATSGLTTTVTGDKHTYDVQLQ